MCRLRAGKLPDDFIAIWSSTRLARSVIDRPNVNEVLKQARLSHKPVESGCLTIQRDWNRKSHANTYELIRDPSYSCRTVSRLQLCQRCQAGVSCLFVESIDEPKFGSEQTEYAARSVGEDGRIVRNQ